MTNYNNPHITKLKNNMDKSEKSDKEIDIQKLINRLIADKQCKNIKFT